jgi:hypothetical protein
MPGNIVDAMKEATEEFHKLPEWQQAALKAKWADIHEGYRKQALTCRHCGQEAKGRCYSCYGG